MEHFSIPQLRLSNQRISAEKYQTASEVVQWFGAMQAQDYLGSLWAVGLRMQTATEASIEQAIKDKQLVRSWPMRGTLHYVHPNDLKWMLRLMASRVIAGSKGRYKQLELTDDVFAKCRKIVTKALSGGKQFTRPNLYKLLEEQNIYVTATPLGSRGLHILGHLAMEGLICFGPREGKQQTFVLIDEWIGRTKELSRDESLAEIAKRYFQSHGPATIQDFVWWTGLTISDAKNAINMMSKYLQVEIIDDQSYYYLNNATLNKHNGNTGDAYLLPAFDEYTVSYKNRAAVLDPQFAKHVNNGGGMLSPIIVMQSMVIGSWKRTLKKNKVVITPLLFEKISKTQREAITVAANKYATFLTTAVQIEFT